MSPKATNIPKARLAYNGGLKGHAKGLGVISQPLEWTTILLASGINYPPPTLAIQLARHLAGSGA